MKTEILSLEGKSVGSIDLPLTAFGVEVRSDILQRAVTWQLNKRRQGNASTKTRGEVRLTGGKMYAQKGTGRARHHSARAPIFVGGGIALGPKPRSFATDLTKKFRRLALATALSAKAKDNKVVVLDEAKAKSHKTKDLVAQLSKLGVSNAVIIVDSHDDNFSKASSNIPHIKVLSTEGANVYDILRAETLVVTKTAVPMIEARVSRS